MLDPDQLRIFLVAAQTLNFSKAAEQLHMSQPSVTQHIQLLEAHFNTPLFIRSGRRVVLSDTGLALIQLARQMVSLSLRTDAIIDSLSKQIHGQLTIACSTTPGKYLLPVLLADFLQKYPMVQARCDVHPRSLAVELLEKGKVHFAVSNSLAEFDQNIEFQKFLSDPVVLIAPLSHPWALRGEIEPEELLSSRFIFREEASGTFRSIRAGLANLGININDLQTNLTMGNSEAIAIAVQSNVGVGFVSQMVVKHMVEGRVAIIRVRGLEICQDVYLCRHRFQPFGSLQNAFWEFASGRQIS
jgi:DNA-binding transcriptional LysR family regulator